jgi:hypothetical protein
MNLASAKVFLANQKGRRLWMAGILAEIIILCRERVISNQ